LIDRIAREGSQWTNVSGPEPQWMTTWNLAPGGTQLDYLRASNGPLIEGEVSLAVMSRRPSGCYKVVIVRSYPSYSPPPATELSDYAPSGGLAPQVAFVQEDDDEASAPFQMVEDLRTWLDLTYDELAQATGVSRGTFFNMRKATPRPSTSRRIARLHAVAHLLVKRFDSSGARAWLVAGEPSPLELLLSQELSTVERLARDRLFSQPDLRPSALHAVGDRPDLELVGAPTSVTRATRRPKRGGGRAPQ
jgi:uncharacterized protein (DUF2384 family)